jgi:hypothetical protein
MRPPAKPRRREGKNSNLRIFAASRETCFAPFFKLNTAADDPAPILLHFACRGSNPAGSFGYCLNKLVLSLSGLVSHDNVDNHRATAVVAEGPQFQSTLDELRLLKCTLFDCFSPAH